MIAIEDEPIIHSTLVSHVLGRDSFIVIYYMKLNRNNGILRLMKTIEKRLFRS